MSDLHESDYQEAGVLLEKLLRLDTSNPPGREREAALLLAGEWEALGLEPVLVGENPDRPNLVVRWTADPVHRNAPPLIVSSHLDVVPAPDAAEWTHPPFSGHNDGTYIWGRGAIDMKGFAVMGLTALRHLKRRQLPIRRDVIFAAVSDEEAGTRLGSEWLVRHRPDLLGGQPEYVINEVGGFTLHRNGRRFYPIQVAEKGVAWLRLTIQGTPGHSSLPAADNAWARMARAIDVIDRTRLPWHPSRETADFLAGFARAEGKIAQRVAPLFQHPRLGPLCLRWLVPYPARRRSLEALLRNTVHATRVSPGREDTPASLNSLPASVSMDLDGRLAPGQSAESLQAELSALLRPVVGDTFSLEALHTSPGVSFSTETPLYRMMEETLLAADPGCHVVPSIIPGFTDSKNYARLGASCYGFYPLQLPPDLEFSALFHGKDERIPVKGFHWGIQTLTNLLARFLTT